ncbi:Protein EPIDERMAL PATTERNING FACTOR 1 [Glycine soja]|uniref:Protein EPIDERMAL PATTERNING FACTOR 1 n=1 Tax=Glycine soja TaxID=3848 RepID=A0A0B2PMQ6_GLYSO|nr:Protein EPIDERMAL PATTERNING FACTOR 1 [Glycine soja]
MGSPSAIGIAKDHHRDHDQLKHSSKMENIGSGRGRTFQIAGSRLPDCMHACGSCSPRRLVTKAWFVWFVVLLWFIGFTWISWW